MLLVCLSSKYFLNILKFIRGECVKLSDVFDMAVDVKNISLKEYNDYFIIGNEAVHKSKVMERKIYNMKDKINKTKR